jgi:phosphoribosylamine--glycine ligase
MGEAGIDGRRIDGVKVLLLGSGGREHALAIALRKSPLLSDLVIVPGNPGTAAVGRNVRLDLDDHAAVERLAREEAVDLVVIGPEAPLVAGLSDRLAAADIAVFGPSRAAAALEGSKGFTKDLCRDCGIPTAAYARFEALGAARAYLAGQAFPIVIKADGLAAGKGVIIAQDAAEAEAALDDMFGGAFGAAGAAVVIEQFLEGDELSFFALCDGTRALPLGSAQDHKRVGDGDTGPNTGGMGAVSPAALASPALDDAIMDLIVRPTLRGMAARGTPFRGVLFAGLMIGPDGPSLIEYNVRFGDPETQVILPRLDEDLLPLLLASATGTLPDRPPRLRDETAIVVVMAAENYPGPPVTGTVIRNVDAAGRLPGVTIVQAGTKTDGERLLANGGRVLGVTAIAPTAAEAQRRAYAAVDAIDWPGGFCRRDIGDRSIAREREA